MSELMLINPKRRKRRTGKRRKMTAKQLLYFGPKRRRHRRRRAVAAARPVRRHRRRSAVVAAPRRRRHSRRRHVTRLRRNPMMGGFSTRRFLNDTLVPSAIGAGGALGVDIALGYFGSYLPASLNSGLPLAGVKIAAAVGIGMLAGMIGGKKVGEEAMAGAIVVTLYGIAKSQVMSFAPALPLHGVGWVTAAPQVGAYVGSDRAYGLPGIGSYVSESEETYYARQYY